MAAPKETIWELEPHTEAKHVILRHYLEAWFPILTSWNERIVYYDGFAGPGRYKGGELGSPIIALNVAREHTARITSELVFVFVDNDRRRTNHLKGEIGKLRLRKNFKWMVLNKKFEVALQETLDYLQERGLQIAPTFAFIDPFGITGLRFELIERLLSQQRCEVLITFMNQAIERWATELPDQIDTLIGQSGAAALITEADNRVVTARQLYEKSLRTAASFVRFFEMRNINDRPIYDLFFASNHDLGHYKMKEAMWKADESGDFRFSDGIDPAQATLFSPDAARDFAPRLGGQFKGQTVHWEEVQRYTRDVTPFLDRHARGALKLLEAEGGVEGHAIKVAKNKADGKLRRKNTYPAGSRITFIE